MSTLAHLAELLPYWARQAQLLERAPGTKFGRTHADPDRLSAIERCSDRAVVTPWWRSETGSVNNHPRNDERRGLSLDWPATSA